MKYFFRSSPWLPTLTLGLALLAGVGRVYPATTLQTNTLIEIGDVAYEGQDLIVNNCTVTINGSHTFNSLWIVNGAVVTHASYATGQVNKLMLTVVQDVIVDVTSRLDVGGKGYPGTLGNGEGPGGGTGQYTDMGGGGGGGAHGGYGGKPESGFSGGAAYGSLAEPQDWGSAGGAGYAGQGGSGGGVVRLVVGGALTVNGTLTASGNNGNAQNYGATGGGAGGSIWVTAGTLAGNGSITANGGAGPLVSEEDGGGGGGGRIALYYGTNNFTGAVTAVGGSGYGRGGAGTIYFKSASAALGRLLVDNDGSAGAATLCGLPNVYEQVTVARAASAQFRGTNVWSITQWIVNQATADVGQTATFTFADGYVTNGSMVLCPAANTRAPVNGQWAGAGVLICAANLWLDTNSSISATGQGYGATETNGGGPGGGLGARVDAAGGGGGGHGGRGGNGAWTNPSENGGWIYGSLIQPVDLGSAGGAGYGGVGGAGGGAIQLMVTNTLYLDGQVMANGASGTAHNYGASGGGAGGSLWLTVGTLTGTGLLSANGGAGPMVSEEDGGGGSGGRIAVYFNASTFAGAMTAYGGGGYVPGAAGTVYTKNSAESLGRLVVANNHQAGALTPWLYPQPLASFRLLDRAVLEVFPGIDVNIRGTMQVRSNAIIICRGTNTTGNLSGLWRGAGVTFNVDEIDLDAGSKISADGQGYTGTSSTGNGPGGGTGTRNDTGGGGGGGAYGGNGGYPGSGFVGGKAYGAIRAPLDLGSAGGAGFAGNGGNGGGALRINVANRATFDGQVTARGNDGAAHSYGASGGGAGGSIWITANTLAGAGLIAANGGLGPIISEEDGGGGGGGRIAIYCQTNDFAGVITAMGGPSTGAGGAGTIYAKTPDQVLGNLILDNQGVNGTQSQFELYDGFGQIIVRGQAKIEVSASHTLVADHLLVDNASALHLQGGAAVMARDFVIASNAVVYCLSRNQAGAISNLWLGEGASLFAGNLLIESNALITGDGFGYVGTAGTGGGPGGGTGTRADNGGGGGGGGYGGSGGGPCSPYAGGPTNGSLTEPLDLGSAGGAGFAGVGASGGGAVRLIVTNRFTHHGSISMNGLNGSTHTYGAAGGGSGGSIWIAANTLEGSGQLIANGGNGAIVSEESSGGGGGGRIAIYSETNVFTGAIVVAGGAGCFRGTNGTLYTQQSPVSLVLPVNVVTNQGPLVFRLHFSEPVTGLTLDEVIVSNAVKTALAGSGAAYEITVAPLAPGLVLCGLPANAAQDAGGRGNCAANPGLVTYAPPPSAPRLSAQLLPERVFGFSFSGMAGQTFLVQYVNNLGESWTPLALLTLTNATPAWFDPISTNTRHRYFRLLWQP